MKIKSIWLKLFIIFFPIAAAVLIFIFRHELYYLGTLFPACPSYTYLNILCPGCGNTRSVQHMLSGDLAGSVRYNPVPLFGIVISLLAYIEIFSILIERPVKIIPRSKLFWKLVILIFSIYFIVRNFVMVF